MAKKAPTKVDTLRAEKVRTTLMLPAPLVKRAKYYAIAVERDLQEVVADALEDYLRGRIAGEPTILAKKA